MYTGGELKLADYNWSLKTWEGKLLATQHFMVSSQGEAANKHRYSMGRYTLCPNFVTPGCIPVYKKDVGDHYLYQCENGNWCVGPVAGDGFAFLNQKSKSPSPSKTIPWKLFSDNGWKEDETLKVYPCYN